MVRGIRKAENWVHALFHKTSELGHGVRHQVGQTQYRFCKTCWPSVDEIPKDISKMQKVGKSLCGCCSAGKVKEQSPGIMQRHIHAHHPNLAPGCAAGDSESEPEVYDPAIQKQRRVIW